MLKLRGPKAKDGIGGVDVVYGDKWGAVCDNDWTTNDANVVCRQLGFYGEKAILVGNQVPNRTSDVRINSVTCRGNERLLAECHPSPRWNYPEIISCNNDENVVGVECLLSPGKNYFLQ